MTTTPKNTTLGRRVLRFAVGAGILGAVFAGIVGIPHPGGEVGAFLDQTESMDVQATALFYADLEQYSDIEGRLWGDDGYRALAARERSAQDQVAAEDSED